VPARDIGSLDGVDRAGERAQVRRGAGPAAGAASTTPTSTTTAPAASSQTEAAPPSR